MRSGERPEALAGAPKCSVPREVIKFRFGGLLAEVHVTLA